MATAASLITDVRSRIVEKEKDNPSPQLLYYRKNRESRRAAQRRYYHANKAKRARATKASNIKRQYNITLEEYEQMIVEQSALCAICRTNAHKNNGSFNIDHDHKTGKVRGLLCSHCNFAVGLLKDDISVMNRMVEYVRSGGWRRQQA